LLADGIRATADLRSAAERKELVILAVSSERMRELAGRARPFLSPSAMLVSPTKGLEPNTHARMSEVLMSATGIADIGAITGPNITTDIVDRQPTAVVIGSSARRVRSAIVGAMDGDAFHVHESSDLVGIELAAALKNVIALSVGLAEGAGFGVNFQAFLISNGLLEIRRIAVALGADPATFSGLAGFGDLFLTVTSHFSQNRRIGVEVGKGRPLADVLAGGRETPEGINTTRECRALVESLDTPTPITTAVYRILHAGLPPRDELLRAWAASRESVRE
jgi:glycerol-3-phosphate dehydrogenase (NAD(P)+)